MMQQHFHAIIWIDHHQAKVFPFNASDVERDVNPAPRSG